MRSDRKALLFGAASAALSVPSLLLLPSPTSWLVASGAVVFGLFVVFIVAERAIPGETAQAAMAGDAATLASLAEGLALAGPLHYVPDQGNVGGERIFLAASDNDRPLPTLDKATALYLGSGGTKAGLACDPSGRALVTQHLREMGAKLEDAPVEAVGSFLAGMLETPDLARRLVVQQEGDAIHVRFAAGAVKPPCFRDEAAPACARTGCALCQSIGCTLTRAMARPLVVRQATVEAPWVEIEFRTADPP